MERTLQRAGPVARIARAALTALYPTTCMMCDARVEEEGALCPTCWADTTFLSGACCDLCGRSLPGDADGVAHCDECLRVERPWDEGRAALAYAGAGRRLVLALKHGDRTELARGAGRWLHARARDILSPGTMIAPVPIHRWRLLRRRYNQSALLAADVARRAGAEFAPQALLRHRQTPSQEKRSFADRFANVADAIAVAPGADVAGRHVAVVDDVMTSGATLSACGEALRGAGAARVTMLILARVAKDDRRA